MHLLQYQRSSLNRLTQGTVTVGVQFIGGGIDRDDTFRACECDKHCTAQQGSQQSEERKILKVGLERVFKNAFLLNMEKYPNCAIPTDVQEIDSAQVFQMIFNHYIYRLIFCKGNKFTKIKGPIRHTRKPLGL